MDLKLSRALARDFGNTLARKVACDPLARNIRGTTSNQREHQEIGDEVEQMLRTFLEARSLGTEAKIVDWEGKTRQRGVRQQQSYSLLGTWTHPDLAVVAPFTVAVEFDREGDSWAGYKLSLMKAACHVLSGAYDAVVHVFILKYRDSERATYLLDEAAPMTSSGEKPNVFTRQLMANLGAHGVVPAFVPAGPDAPLAAG